MKLLWMITILLGLVSASSVQRCPEKCDCNTPSVATCSSIPASKFSVEVFKLQIVNPVEPLKLSADVFKYLQSVNQLVIENATITSIDENAFSTLKLTDLIIRNSIIPEIPTNAFQPLTELKVIDFSHSKLTNFYDINSETVREIHLMGCEIKELPNSAFENCTRLAYLNLAHNSLKQINGEYEFDVEYLNVSHNAIEEVNFDAIAFESVVNLDLSYNPIKSIKGDDTSVVTLYMKSCNLKDIDFAAKLITVVHLDVSSNEIRKIDESLYNLSELEILDLSNNKIQSVPERVFSRNPRLATVILDNNDLKTLPILRTDNTVLRIDYFSCNNCGMESLNDDTFKFARTIKTLILSNNKINVLPDNLFHNIPGLVKIDLSNNALTHIDNGAFIKNSALKTVILSGNPLKSIDASIFKSNRVLKELDVSGCHLNYLWARISSVKIPSLTILNAEKNNITLVTFDELKITKNLENLELGANPLKCTNLFFDMKRWMVDNSISALKVKESLPINPAMATETISETWMDICGEEDDAYYDTIAYTDIADKNEDKDDLDVEIDPAEDGEYHDVTTYTYQTDSEFINDDEFLADAGLTKEFEGIGYKKHSPRQVIVFLLPTLVFVLTALVVLILTVSIILCVVMNRKNTRTNAPQINIIPWRGQKVKKHSGSVYKPLSEEKFPV